MWEDAFSSCSTTLSQALGADVKIVEIFLRSEKYFFAQRWGDAEKDEIF
jgi:hypothetical protein